MSFMRNALVAALIVLGLLGTTAAAAKDARVVVVAEGESFGAIPKFRLWADARLVGEAQLGRSPGTSGAETTDENLVHYGGQFEFIVRNVQNVQFLGIGFANDTNSSSGKPGVRSLTITRKSPWTVSQSTPALSLAAKMPALRSAEKVGC